MKKSQKSLRDWTNQKWRTSDGSPSKGKKRYLPDAAWKALSPGEKAATNRAKAKGDKKGKQFVKQPKNIAKKTAKYRAMGGLISNKFQNGGQLPKYETTLSLKEEANFMPWLESQYKAGNITKGDFDFYKKNNYGYDYDFRAAYKEGLKSSLNSKDNMQHWGDIGKKPNHPTFSNESKYHNVDGNIGGSWDGENFIPAQKQMGGTLPYVAPDLLEVEVTPEGTELKDQPRELEAYYRDYAAQYPVTDKKDITKQYKEGARNYAAEQLLKANPQGDRNRKDWINSFTSPELAVLRNSESKGKVNPTLMQKFEGALKQGAAAGAPGDLRYKKVETESLTGEEMQDVGALDLLGPIAIPAKLVQAGYKDGYSFLDALKGQENDASLIEDIATDPLNLVGIGLVSKGASAAKLLKAYKNLSKLSNTKRASTLQTLNKKLRNNPSYVINPEVRSTEKLAKESEPYLKSSTPPRSRQDEIVEGFAPGLRQERIERTTVNFNPDGSVVPQVADGLAMKTSTPKNIDELLTLPEEEILNLTGTKKSTWELFKNSPKISKEVVESKLAKALKKEQSLVNLPTVPQNKVPKETRNLVKEGRKDAINWIKSDEWLKRRIKATGESKEQAEAMRKTMIEDLENTTVDFKNIQGKKVDAQGIKYADEENNKRIALGFEDDLFSLRGNAAHEFIHAATSNPKSYQGIKMDNLYPEIASNVNTNTKDFLRYLNQNPEKQVRGVKALQHLKEVGKWDGSSKITDDMVDYLKKNAYQFRKAGMDNDIAQLVSTAKDKKILKDFLNSVYTTSGIIAGGTTAGTAMSQEKAMGGTLDKSVMGYRDDSPYKNEPYIDINTPTGEIDMSKTGVSLYANGKLLKPYSGKHKFNTSKVREVPVSNSWLDKYK